MLWAVLGHAQYRLVRTVALEGPMNDRRFKHKARDAARCHVFGVTPVKPKVARTAHKRDNARPTGMRSLRRALMALGAVGFVAGAVPLALALANEGGHQRTLIAVTGPLIGWAFIGTGIFAWLRRLRTASAR